MRKPISPDEVIWGHGGNGRYGVLLLPWGPMEAAGDKPVLLLCVARRNNSGRLCELKHAELTVDDLEHLEREIQAAKERLQS